jgi:hypothetical protein
VTIELGFLQDRTRGVNVLIKRLSLDDVPTLAEKEILKTGDRLAVEIEPNGRENAPKIIAERAISADGISAIVNQYGNSFIFGPKEKVIDFLTPPEDKSMSEEQFDAWDRQCPLHPDLRDELTKLYDHKLSQIREKS